MDLRLNELVLKLDEYTNKIKKTESELREYKKTRSVLNEELNNYLDGKQGNLIEV